MRIRDTLTGSAIDPSQEGRCRIYLCGVTVYDEAHVGHARTIITFDVFRRHLESLGVRVMLVQNFTDVDDKIIRRAETEGVSAAALSSRYIRRYFDDSDALNIKRADRYPKATEHMQDILGVIGRLVESKAAYRAQNGVYFAVSKSSGYGKLSKKRIEELYSGARVQVDRSKQDPLDFALWKIADSGPSWPSPWGEGRPGWHIECSAMSLKYLGESFDVHGGGRDLIFPHHENEIAQSEAVTSKQPARIWMHVGMVTIEGEKMSKSLNNTKSIRDALARWGPNIIRLFCLLGHYSKPINYTEDTLAELVSRWRQAETAYHELLHAISVPDQTEPTGDVQEGYLTRFGQHLDDDLNTHMALEEFFGLASYINGVVAKDGLSQSLAHSLLREFEQMAGILGLCMSVAPSENVPGIRESIRRRALLRAQKRYAEADDIRDMLEQDGVDLVDRGSETIWIKREAIPGQDI